MTAKEHFTEILEILINHDQDVIAGAIVSIKGFPIVSMLPDDVDESIISAITSAINNITKCIINDLKIGDCKEIHILSNKGDIILSPAGNDAVIVLLKRVEKLSTSKKEEICLNL